LPDQFALFGEQKPEDWQRIMPRDSPRIYPRNTYVAARYIFIGKYSVEIKSMTGTKKMGLFALAWLGAWAVQAQDANTRLQTRALVASCASCHGTDGRTVDGSAIPPLAGSSKADITQQMKAFKEGTRPATVMHQLSKGYTDEQIDRISTYFAAVKR